MAIQTHRSTCVNQPTRRVESCVRVEDVENTKSDIDDQIAPLPWWEVMGIPKSDVCAFSLAECHRQSPDQRHRSQRGTAPGVEREVHVRPLGHGDAHGGEGGLLIWSRKDGRGVEPKRGWLYRTSRANCSCACSGGMGRLLELVWVGMGCISPL